MLDIEALPGLSRPERVQAVDSWLAGLLADAVAGTPSPRQRRGGAPQQTGTDGIAVWVNEFLGTRGTPHEVKLTQIVKIQKWVMDQYNEHGRLTAISDAELAEQVRTHLPKLYAKHKAGA